MQETSEGQTYFCKECEEEFRNPDVKLQPHTCGKKVNTLKQIHERFDEKIGEHLKIVIQSYSQEVCDDIKSFIESEIQLALAERDKEIVEMIENWTPKKEKGFYAGGGKIEMTLDDHKRNFSKDILSLISKNK